MPTTNIGASALAPLLDGSSAGELIPELVRHGLQQLIELEVVDINLQIPKLRAGSFLPSILEPRRRVDQALYGVVLEACTGDISRYQVSLI